MPLKAIITLQIGSKVGLCFSLEEGIEFIKQLEKAEIVTTDYSNKFTGICDDDFPPVTVTFISEDKMKEIRLSNTLEGKT